MKRWAVVGATAVGVIAAAVWGLRSGQAPVQATSAPLAPQLTVTPGQGPPNVLFVVWDTVRADRLSVYGHDKPTTPTLEALASQAVLYDHAVAPSYWTLPSHASLFTGLPVSTHGANATHKWLDSRFITMAEHFSDHGYDTYAWSSNPNINLSANTVQGFQTFHQPFAHNAMRRQVERFTRTLIRRDDRTTVPSPNRYQSIAYHKAGPVTHAAFTGWLEAGRDPDKPFFAFLNYMEAHAYRLPTERARRAVASDRAAYRQALNTPNLLRKQTNIMYGKWRPYTRAEREGLYDLYDASIVDLDAYLADLLTYLEAEGLMSNTLIVLTSDHGEQLGEHNLYLHNFSVYEPLVHVPLMLYWPGHLSPGRVDTQVSTAALFHTLNTLAGLPDPDQPLLLEDLTEPSGAGAVSELTVACGHPEQRRLNPEIRDWSATYRAIVRDGAKLIMASNGQHELYDLERDPLERRNLYGRPLFQERFEALKGELEAWVKAIPQVARTAQDEAEEEAERAAIDSEELADQLEQLGYAE